MNQTPEFTLYLNHDGQHPGNNLPWSASVRVNFGVEQCFACKAESLSRLLLDVADKIKFFETLGKLPYPLACMVADELRKNNVVT